MTTKILYISNNTGIGGQEIVLKRLLESLDKTLYQADVLIATVKGPLHDEYEKHSNAVFLYRDNSNISINDLIFQLVRENNYDVVHFFNLWVLYDTVLRLKRAFPHIKVMATLCVDLYFHRDLYATSFRLMEKIQPHLWAFITDSEMNKKVFTDITVIRNGIPIKKFKPATKKPKTVAWIGRMVYGKRAHLIPDIAKNLPDYKFVMIGDRETKEYNYIMERKPTNLEVRLALTEDEVAQILSETQYFLFTSASESMPLTILEAMASECCVVSEEVGDIPSVLHDGVNGYLVPKDTLLVDWVSKNLPLLDIEVSKNARRAILDDFSLNQMVKKYEFLYGDIGIHNDEPRLAFIYVYPNFYEGFWENKKDSMQHAIAELSKTCAVQLYTPTNKSVHRKIINGQNICFYKHKDVDDLIINLKKFNPQMIFMKQIRSDLWPHVVKAFPNAWKSIMHYGDQVLQISPDANEIDLLIVQQDYMRKKIAGANNIHIKKTMTTTYCIKEDLFKPLDIEKKYTGIMVADFRKIYKRQHLLIKAWKGIPGRLLLLGRFERSNPPNYHNECMELAKSLGIDDRIDFKDGCPYEEVASFVNQAKIAFFTSSREGGSRALLEMMACGLPALVLGDCSGTFHMVRDGVDGRIAMPTPRHIAFEAGRILENWEQMGREASKAARGKYYYNRMYEQYRGLVQSVMEKRKRES